MMTFLHVLLVVLVGGMSAGCGVWIEIAARGVHEAFVLQHVRKLHRRFVLPGPVLLPVSGVITAWVGDLPLTLGGVVAAAIWALVLAAMLVYGWLVTRQLLAPEEVGPTDRGYRHLARAGVVLGVFVEACSP